MAETKIWVPYLFEVQSYVTGHHIHINIWTSTLAEESAAITEPKNPYFKYAVKVLKYNEVVGHIPRGLSKYCTSTLLCGETVGCVVIAAFNTQRPGNYSICLSGQIFLATIFVMKTNQVLRPFSTTTEKTIC